MKLTNKALEKINGSPELKTLLALELKKSVYTIQKYINGNDDELTKASVLNLIQEKTGLAQEEILTESDPIPNKII